MLFKIRNQLSDVLTICYGILRHRKLRKKESRQAPAVSSLALQEAQELFGDPDELILNRQKNLEMSEYRETKLEDEFEPIVVSEKYMTEQDDQIRKLDIPERMQVIRVLCGSSKFPD